MRTLAQKQNQSPKQASSSFARSNRTTLASNHHASRFLHLQRSIGNQAVQRLMQAEPDSLKHFQTKRVGLRDLRQSSLPSIVHEVLRSPGQSLDSESRAFMESRFGHDFSRVRVHSDARAAESAQAVDAVAYTAGRHLVFGEGQYLPSTEPGRRLLAHELAHSIQQGFVADPSPQIVGAPGTALERQADEVANGVINNVSPGAGTSIGPIVQATLLQREEQLIPDLDLPSSEEKTSEEKRQTSTAHETMPPHCGKASTWTCGEKGMGTTCEGCGIELDSWPNQDPCRKVESKGTPRTCFCKSVLNKIGTRVAAYKPKLCGQKLKVKDQDSGTEAIVTVVDAGPYAKDKDRIIDLHEDVFGKGSHIFNVCVSPHPGVDDRLHNCWEGFGGVPPAKPKKETKSKKAGK